ncbi:MAG: hypothetical protein NTW96_04450, partial [Planctomycetia bacterium]|nr:hypothetical protein [Planctomycetia bacterium]
SPQSNGDVYSGAWAYPEGPSCGGRSWDVCRAFLARYLARYAAEADSAWAREIARREIILSFYHFHESGKCEDNIDCGGGDQPARRVERESCPRYPATIDACTTRNGGTRPTS